MTSSTQSASYLEESESKFGSQSSTLPNSWRPASSPLSALALFALTTTPAEAQETIIKSMLLPQVSKTPLFPDSPTTDLHSVSGFLSDSSYRAPWVSYQRISNSTAFMNDLRKFSIPTRLTKWERVTVDLNRWSDFAFDWDGSEGIAPSLRMIENAKAVLSQLQQNNIDHIVHYIDGDGEIGFRWHYPGNIAAAISVLSDGSVLAYLDDRTKNKLLEFESNKIDDFPFDQFFRSAAEHNVS